MEKIRIGCDITDNQVAFLKRDFITSYPYIMYDNGKVIKNFDVGLLFDSSEYTKNKFDMLGVPYIGCTRKDKFEQILHLASLDISTPDSYKSVVRDCFGDVVDDYAMIVSNNDMHEEVIVKSENGARGLGQVLLTVAILPKFLDDATNEKIGGKQLYEKYNTNIGGSCRSEYEECEYLKKTIMSDSYFIQKRVEVTREWRYCYFYGCEPIIVERDTSKGWQANSCITGKGKISNIDEHENMMSIASTLANSMDAPILSIDFYEDSHGRLGVFEYQMQMGYSQLPIRDVVNKTNQAVKNMLSKKGLI